jgi:hypothetical protein
MERSLAMSDLHQAAMGDNGSDQKRRRIHNKQDRDLLFHTPVSNFKNRSMDTYLKSLLPFVE